MPSHWVYSRLPRPTTPPQATDGHEWLELLLFRNPDKRDGLPFFALKSGTAHDDDFLMESISDLDTVWYEVLTAKFLISLPIGVAVTLFSNPRPRKERERQRETRYAASHP